MPHPPNKRIKGHSVQTQQSLGCSGFHHLIPVTPFNPATLQDCIQALPSNIHWSIAEFRATDNGEHIAQAIVHHTAIALSDGSFKNQRGSSAWVVKGESEIGCIKRWNMVPGTDYDHSAYRS